MKIAAQAQPALQELTQRLEELRFAMPTLREADTMCALSIAASGVAGEPIGLGAHAAFGVAPSRSARAG